MKAGLSSLSVLKAWLLAPALRDATDYDAQIAAIGLGVAARMERYCARKFERTVDEVYETNADRTAMVVDRFPIETITKIEVRDDRSTGWIDQGPVDNVLFNAREQFGILEFAGYLGGTFSRIRVTYTGGYWFDTTEDATGTLPDGATPLPDDLKLAWLNQCAFLWGQMDKLGISIAEKPKSDAPLSQSELLPEVKQTLNAYVRFSSS